MSRPGPETADHEGRTVATSGLLAGRVAVVTGAARGIGRAIAGRMAEQGAAVAVMDVDAAAVRDAADEIAGATGARTWAGAVDVTDAAALTRAADAVEGELGVVDVIVPNAGILVLKPALDLTASELESVWRVNLLGAFLTATEFARRLVDRGRPGQVVFTSSLFGTRGGAGNAAYSASKFAVIGLAQSMAADLAAASIRVNSVCPGQIDSAMMDQLFDDRAAQDGGTAAAERARFVSDIPLGRLGDAAEVADTYVYLASDLSRYVTGQHLVVDGGWSVG